MITSFSAVSTRCAAPSAEILAPRPVRPASAPPRRRTSAPGTARQVQWLLTQTSERAGQTAPSPRVRAARRRLGPGHLLGRGRGRGHPADRAGRARPQRRLRGLRPALRPLPPERLPLPLLPGRLGAARRGPHRRDVLPGAALMSTVPLAGQGLRRLADDHRPQPDHRPLQGRPHPPRAHHRGHEHPRHHHRGPGDRGARLAHQRGAARGAQRASDRAARVPGDAVPPGLSIAETAECSVAAPARSSSCSCAASATWPGSCPRGCAEVSTVGNVSETA